MVVWVCRRHSQDHPWPHRFVTYVNSTASLAQALLTAAWAYSLTLGSKQTARTNSQDILNIITLGYNNIYTQYCAYFWDLLVLVTGIPVAAIMVRLLI